MEVSQRELIARDGTRIGYQMRGADGPAIVFANGLGSSHIAYEPLIASLPGYRTLCWDYRGMFSSGQPAAEDANTVSHQVDDLLDLLAAEGIDEFVIVGWSMGVQVALEALHRVPRRARGAFLLNGTQGRLFRTLMGNAAVGMTMPFLLSLLHAQSRIANFVTRRIGRARSSVRSMQMFGILSGTVDRDRMHAVLTRFGDIDWKSYARLLHRLDEHETRDFLSSIDVPVAILAGGRDLFTPVAQSEELHHAIPGSYLSIIPGGTHYMPIEFPLVVGAQLRKWLDRIPGWEHGSSTARTAVAR
ncbi:MAG TPA: alpha/beta hydrolase [Kofleriaceae bacterium]|jgi:pimeloyl-[acyl-carrier protein] methyl ester esterase